MNRCLPQQTRFQTSFIEREILFDADRITLSREEYIELRSQSAESIHWRWAYEAVCKREKALEYELKYKVNYWKAQHAKAREREEELKVEIKERDAKIRDLNQRYFGKKSEQAITSEISPEGADIAKKRPKGQQKGKAGHGRTKHSNLPVHQESIPLNQTACPKCGKEYSSLADEESEIIEVEIAAHIRHIGRNRCAKNCTCTPGSKIITASVPPKLFPKTIYGTSVWTEVLLNKFLYAQPINRILNNFSSLGLKISPGTIAGGLQKTVPLFEPLYKAFYQEQMKEIRFHCDESRWEVYVVKEGKTGYRNYIWVFRSPKVVYYIIDPTRSAKVPIKHFSELENEKVTVICDRYGSYKKLERLNAKVTLSYCWAHVRRDFVNFIRNHPHLKDWGLKWLAVINNIFHINNERLSVWDSKLSLSAQSVAFKEQQKILRSALVKMKRDVDSLLAADKKAKVSEQLAKPQLTVIKSLQNHRKGLIVFYKHPEIPMDNNPAERSIRNPVIGRKNYYGSGSLWSADLASRMFSIFQTMSLWNINQRTWLTLFLQACTQNKGKSPENLDEFLPWKMSEERLEALRKPLPKNSS